MVGIGTLINVIAIVVGGIIGMIFKRLITERIQETLTKAAGLSVIFIGISGAISKLITINGGKLETGGSLMLILSFIIGSFVGELLNIEKRFEDFGEWLKKKSGSQEDNQFVNAFITTSFTVCIGAMAIVGSIEEGITGDASIIITKALLDFIIVTMLSSTLGKGAVFSAIPVAILQWSVTFLSVFIASFVTEKLIWNISLVGSILIFCVGVNLVSPKKFKVANMLPALVVAGLASLIA